MNERENSVNSTDYVYRAIHPNRNFIKADGSISSAAFKDPKGLSVEQGLGRADKDVVTHIRQAKLQGKITKISVKVCINANITIYNDKAKNIYHRLLLNRPYDHNGNNTLTKTQARALATNISALL
ncbi:MAG: hypothetical protein NC299_09255 [Lachnospiraceae bacterium]|nr:hypothetical protein [Ruminococcus sp.]MCM1275540.1 hypothetical protein [Lachnospiraceae bacterium]